LSHSHLHRIAEPHAAALLQQYGAATAAKRRRTGFLAVVVVLCAALAAWGGEVDLGKLAQGLPRFSSYIYEILPKLRLAHLTTDLAEWFWNWDGWLALLGETLLVAYVGTFLGAAIAFCFCFFASANLVKNAVARILVRRSLEFFRTVPDIVFALLFVYALGLGPVPGVLAIAIHTVGALGKQFAEVVENIDMNPVEGVKAGGANWFEQVRFGALPQVLSNFVSYTLLRFEINVRGASVMGFVGAGGIGKELLSSIRQFYYSDVSAILLMIIVTVFAIDLLTERLRFRLIGIEGRA
jgi:phosphonate transport system permease protein